MENLHKAVMEGWFMLPSLDFIKLAYGCSWLPPSKKILLMLVKGAGLHVNMNSVFRVLLG